MSKAVIATMMHKLQGTHRYTDIANEVNVSVTTVIRTSTKTVNFGIPPHLPQLLPLMSLEKMLADINSISSSQIQKVDEY